MIERVVTGLRFYLGFAPRLRRVLSGQAGETKVEDLGAAFRRDHHVLGLEVAVHDAIHVGGREPAVSPTS